MVEPDCFIEFENVVIIIEAKLDDDRTQQYVEQLGKELIAYWETSLQKPVMLLAIGGLADYSSKTIDKLREDINNYLKSQLSTVPNFIFSAVSWSKLFKIIESQVKLSHEKRMVDDIREAMLRHGIEVRDPVWLADLRKLQLKHGLTMPLDNSAFTGALK
jgi:hypothetical protein